MRWHSQLHIPDIVQELHLKVDSHSAREWISWWCRHSCFFINSRNRLTPSCHHSLFL
jgi:hypothetical protein